MKMYTLLTVVFFAVMTVMPGTAWSETKLSDKVTLGGAIEVEAGIVNEEVDDSSDIALATVEIVLDGNINENVAGHVVLLYEEGAKELDEGTITIKTAAGLTIAVGKMYIPFGSFNSHFISDPETLELGETNETALMFGYTKDMIELSVGLFNGNVNEVGDDDKVDDYVASLAVTPVEGINFGASYISDISDTDGDITGAAAGAGTVTDIVAGYGAFVSASFGPLTIDAEYLAAADNFEPADLDNENGDGTGDGSGDQPVTFNFEVAYAVSDAWEVAVRYEGNEELFDLPETQYGVAAAYGLYENTTLSFEYLTGEFDNLASDEVSSVTAQLAVEF